MARRERLDLQRKILVRERARERKGGVADVLKDGVRVPRICGKP